MKQFLCLKNNQPWYQDFKIGKIYTGDEGVIEDDHRCDWRAGELLEDGIVKPIETFEKDGHTWIRHSGGDCPVPDSWFVEVMVDTDTGADKALNFFWGDCSHRIGAYRIISTEEPETEEVELHLFRNDSDERSLSPQEDPEKFDMSMDNWKEVSERDYRQPSPQEAAYAAKMAEKDEDESGAGGGKTFPSSSLRDMSDKTFANLLGMNQFIGGGE